jgi:DNA-binding LytR/AlgR family response regulator
MSSQIIPTQEYVFIKSEYKIVKIKFDDILFCKGMKDYIQIFIYGKPKPVLTLNSLTFFATKLPAQKFIRVHKSYIVSMNYIDTISKNEIYIENQVVPIGNNFKSGFFKVVEINS